MGFVVDHAAIDMQILGFGERTRRVDVRMDDMVAGAVDGEDGDGHDEGVAGRGRGLVGGVCLEGQGLDGVLDQRDGARLVLEAQDRRVGHDLLAPVQAQHVQCRRVDEAVERHGVFHGHAEPCGLDRVHVRS